MTNQPYAAYSAV